jgi:hypothetical protein
LVRQGALAFVLTYAPIPTTDLYFLGSCGDLVARAWRRGPVQRLGANCFRVGNRYLVMRRDRERLVRAILDDTDAEIIYLIDDNLAATDDASLPEGYRDRLCTLRDGIFKDMMARASLVVTSADAIKAALPEGVPVRHLDPVWQGMPKVGRHLARSEGERLDVVHLGTGSHGAGFDFLVPALEAVLGKLPHVHFHYFSSYELLGRLDGHARVHRMRGKSWSAYKRALPGFRFHLGLYPLPDTPFNAARSVNKILEYTLAGCPAMYTAEWAAARGLEDGVNAFLVSGGAEAWEARLTDVLKRPDMLASVYEGARGYYARYNDPAAQRAFWQDVFIKDGR